MIWKIVLLCITFSWFTVFSFVSFFELNVYVLFFYLIWGDFHFFFSLSQKCTLIRITIRKRAHIILTIRKQLMASVVATERRWFLNCKWLVHLHRRENVILIINGQTNRINHKSANPLLSPLPHHCWHLVG